MQRLNQNKMKKDAGKSWELSSFFECFDELNKIIQYKVCEHREADMKYTNYWFISQKQNTCKIITVSY